MPTSDHTTLNPGLPHLPWEHELIETLWALLRLLLHSRCRRSRIGMDRRDVALHAHRMLTHGFDIVSKELAS